MQLLYLWTNDPRSRIREQDLNFWGKYSFHLEENEKLAFKLTYRENENYIENFFGEKISDVTAVIGENGSGKTTLLDFIKLNISHWVGNTNFDFVALFSVPSKKEIVVYSYGMRDIQIPSGPLSFFFAHYKAEDYYSITEESPTPFIHFSNSLDYNIEFDSSNFEISTKSLLHNLSEESKKSSIPLLDLFSFKELEKQVEFVFNYNGEIPFGLPTELRFARDEFDPDILRRHAHFNRKDTGSHSDIFKKAQDKFESE